jgi:Holliday junction resolvase-like predicted endonuclease
LVAGYREDIQKYAVGLDKARITNVFESVPIQLAKENKKFQASKVAGTGRFADYRGCLEWLRTAGMVLLCHCLTFPELPLKGNYDPKKVKAYYADTGLLIAHLDDESQMDFRANRNLGVYKGALYESIVAEALTKCGYDLYYYKRENSTLEQDFFVRTADSLVPIEVKPRDGRTKAMRTLITDSRYPDISWGIKLHAGNIGQTGSVRMFPYWCTFLLRDYLTLSER